MTTGELIRKYRKEKGLTQQELAEKCELATITVRQYESNMRVPKNMGILRQMADVLEIPVENLLDIKPIHFKEKTLQDFTTDELLKEIKRRLEQ